MPCRPRLAAAGIPWSIIQRGNNRSACFEVEARQLAKNVYPWAWRRLRAKGKIK